MANVSPQSRIYIEELFLGEAVTQANPTIYATCGIPGAGKSTFVDKKLGVGEFPPYAFMLNPDRVMLALPEYQEDCESVGAQQAYEKWELPVRNLAYAMADIAAQQRCHVIKDMGGANPLSFEYIKRLKEEGYQVHMYHIHCDADEALRRINQREFQISRVEVLERLQSLNDLLPQYRLLADEFTYIDNTVY